MELAFPGMELHPPFLTPFVQAIQVFLEDLCVGNAVDGLVDDSVISEEPLMSLIYIRKRVGPNTEPCSTPETGQGSENTPSRTTH